MESSEAPAASFTRPFSYHLPSGSGGVAGHASAAQLPSLKRAPLSFSLRGKRKRVNPRGAARCKRQRTCAAVPETEMPSTTLVDHDEVQWRTIGDTELQPGESEHLAHVKGELLEWVLGTTRKAEKALEDPIMAKLSASDRVKQEYSKGAAAKLSDPLADCKVSLTMNLFARGFCFDNQTTCFPYSPQTLPLIEAIDGGQLTSDLMDLFDDIPCHFHNGGLVVLIRDFRHASPCMPMPVEKRVLLRPDSACLLGDVEHLTRKISPHLAPDVLISIERKLLKRIRFKPICLEPHAEVGVLASMLSVNRAKLANVPLPRFIRTVSPTETEPERVFPFPSALKHITEDKPAAVEKFALLKFLQRRNSISSYSSKLSSSGPPSVMSHSTPGGISSTSGTPPLSIPSSGPSSRGSPSKRSSTSNIGNALPKLSVNTCLHYAPSTSIVLRRRVLKFQQSSPTVRKFIMLEIDRDDGAVPFARSESAHSAASGSSSRSPAPGAASTIAAAPGTPSPSQQQPSAASSPSPAATSTSSPGSSASSPQSSMGASTAERRETTPHVAGGYRGVVRAGSSEETAVFCYSFPLRSAEEALHIVRYFTRLNELEGMMISYDSAVAEQRQAHAQQQQQQQQAAAHMSRIHGGMPGSKQKLASRQAVQQSEFLAMLRSRPNAVQPYLAAGNGTAAQIPEQRRPMYNTPYLRNSLAGYPVQQQQGQVPAAGMMHAGSRTGSAPPNSASSTYHQAGMQQRSVPSQPHAAQQRYPAGYRAQARMPMAYAPGQQPPPGSTPYPMQTSGGTAQGKGYPQNMAYHQQQAGQHSAAAAVAAAAAAAAQAGGGSGAHMGMMTGAVSVRPLSGSLSSSAPLSSESVRAQHSADVS